MSEEIAHLSDKQLLKAWRDIDNLLSNPAWNLMTTWDDLYCSREGMRQAFEDTQAVIEMEAYRRVEAGEAEPRWHVTVFDEPNRYDDWFDDKQTAIDAIESYLASNDMSFDEVEDGEPRVAWVRWKQGYIGKPGRFVASTERTMSPVMELYKTLEWRRKQELLS